MVDYFKINFRRRVFTVSPARMVQFFELRPLYLALYFDFSPSARLLRPLYLELFSNQYFLLLEKCRSKYNFKSVGSTKKVEDRILVEVQKSSNWSVPITYVLLVTAFLVRFSTLFFYSKMHPSLIG